MSKERSDINFIVGFLKECRIIIKEAYTRNSGPTGIAYELLLTLSKRSQSKGRELIGYHYT
jgi:hypothetical protein